MDMTCIGSSLAPPQAMANLLFSAEFKSNIQLVLLHIQMAMYCCMR